MIEFFLFLLLGALAWLALEIVRRDDNRSHAVRRELGWLPPHLQRSELILAEPRAMCISTPVKAVAKVDRAYRVKDVVVPVEFKTRRQHRVFDTDVVELSVQRLVLEGHGLGPVADLVYVVTEHPDTGRRRRHTVGLLSREKTVRLVQRYHALRTGMDMRAMTDDPRRCRNCGHRARCHGA